MNYTKLTIGLSQDALTKEINALCAWIDTCNLSTLPPIVNPTQESASQIENAISESYNIVALRLSGYVNSFTIKGDITSFTITCPELNETKRTLLVGAMEQFVTCNAVAMLYESQPQARHIVQEYATKRNAALTSAKQLLASTQ